VPADLSDALLAASRAAPQLDPAHVYGIASSANLDDVPDNAVSTAALGDIMKQKSFLQASPDDVQSQSWQGMDENRQKMLASVGYNPPAVHKTSSGLWGVATRALGKAAHVLFVGPAELTAHDVSTALHAMGAPLRGVQHGVRASVALEDEMHAAGAGPFTSQRIATTLSPTEWRQAWHATTNGEQTFRASGMQQVQDKYGDDVFGIAHAIASAPVDKKQQAISAYILSQPEGERAALSQRIQDDPDIANAVAELEANKMSVGRVFVGDGMLTKHPALGHALSGLIDGTFDWFADPVVIGSKFAKGAELSRYAIQTVDDVDRVSQYKGAQAFAEDVAKTLREGKDGGAAELVRRYPKMDAIAADLAKNKVHTADDFFEWTKGVVGFRAMLEGEATGAMRAGVVFPHNGPLSRIALDAKEAARTSINWAAESDKLGVGQIGKFAKGATILTAPGETFDAYSKHALTTVQRLASYVLPASRVDDLVDMWAKAPDVGTKRDIYKSMLKEMADAAGITATQDGKQWLNDKITTVTDLIDHSTFSGSDADLVTRDGRTVSRGLLENHLTTEWAMPSFKEWSKQALRTNTLDKLYNGTVNADLTDALMTNGWKPAQLLRLGFATRAGGEELVSAILREGLFNIARGKLAAGSVKGTLAGAEDRVLPVHPLHAVWERMTHHLPQELVDRIETPSDFAGAVFGDRARRAFRDVEGKLAGEKYLNAAKELADLYPNMLPHTITAAEHAGGGYLDDARSVVKVANRGNSARAAYFAPQGDFIHYEPQEDLFSYAWRKNLQEAQNSALGRAAIENVGDRDAQISAVSDILDSDGFAKMRARAERNNYTTDGRIVGTTATADEATRDWAEAVVDHVNNLVHDHSGNLIDDVHSALLEKKLPSVTELDAIDRALRPASVHGREMVEVSRNWVRDAMNKGFSELVGKPMDWMVRQPLFIHNYATALDEVAGLRALPGADATIREVALQRALNKTIPFIHDPALKSQFSVNTRNLMPFWFAQEQFYKRWVNVAKHSPEAFREAQLTMMGLRHSGVVHTDENGNDWFVYPGVGAAIQAATKGLEMLPGQKGKWTLPLPVGFSGQVRFASPGLERLGAPTFGPLVGIPMHAMSQMFPELSPVEEGVLGERGAGRAYWEQVTPTTVSRVVHSFVDKPDTSPQLASAMMQAMAYLDAKGFTPDDQAPAPVREAYIERVRNWARILFLARTAYGYSAPASPDLQLDPNHLHTELHQLMSPDTGLTVDEAMAEFLRRHPDATAYTVFQSKSASGAQLPATDKAAKFMVDHDAFLKAYPQASGWFIPKHPATTASRSPRTASSWRCISAPARRPASITTTSSTRKRRRRTSIPVTARTRR
jgi:hypothetical protein